MDEHFATQLIYKCNSSISKEIITKLIMQQPQEFVEMTILVQVYRIEHPAELDINFDTTNTFCTWIYLDIMAIYCITCQPP